VVRLWDLAAKKEKASLIGHTQEVRSMAITADGKTLATGTHDRTVKLWDLVAAKELTTVRGFALVTAVAITPDGKVLAVGGVDRTIKLFNLALDKR
jgi:WD40 repeat protein